jgi:hypothetical protein
MEKLSLTDQGKLYEFVGKWTSVIEKSEKEGIQMPGTKETVERIKDILRRQ